MGNGDKDAEIRRLKERIAANQPFNTIVSELLGSTGGTFDNPATNFYQVERDNLKLSENVAQRGMDQRQFTMRARQRFEHFDRRIQFIKRAQRASAS